MRSMRQTMALLMTALILIISGLPAFAETGYVSDMLILSMREGPGREFNVIATLRSNMAVEILEKQPPFLKVETESGDQGWVEAQYITLETPKSILAEQLARKVASLEKELELALEPQDVQDDIIDADGGADEGEQLALKNELEIIRSEKQALMDETASLKEALAQLKAQYSETPQAEADAERVRENQALKEEIQALKAGSGNKTHDPGDVLKVGMIKWFLSGAGVLIAGWLLGKSMTGSRRKKSGGLLS